MKWGLIILAVATVILAGVAAARGELGAGLRHGAVQGVKFIPILIVAFVLMGLMHVLLPASVVQGWLSDESGWRGLGIAWLAGALTPAGTIIGMPIAAGLVKSGASASVAVTYLTSLAVLSVIRVPLEVGFYGWRLMLVRILASLLLPFAAGIFTRWIGPLLLTGGS